MSTHRVSNYTGIAVTEEVGQLAEQKELDAEALARRRLALAQIRQYPDPILRMRAKDVTEFGPDLQRLAERLEQLMHDAAGVGLAATQIGILQRVFVFTRDGEAFVVANPVLTNLSEETEVDDEGCLSLQGVLVPVERHVSLTLEGKDIEGNDVTFDLEGHAARVVQHELDHLDGTMIIERTTDEARKAALATLRPRPILTTG
ncbi:MAG: peptide deformylase [Gaiellaceae bacterium]|nr:peptide deformylase [Gaiellaceae bacterium]